MCLRKVIWCSNDATLIFSVWSILYDLIPGFCYRVWVLACNRNYVYYVKVKQFFFWGGRNFRSLLVWYAKKFWMMFNLILGFYFTVLLLKFKVLDVGKIHVSYQHNCTRWCSIFFIFFYNYKYDDYKMFSWIGPLHLLHLLWRYLFNAREKQDLGASVSLFCIRILHQMC